MKDETWAALAHAGRRIGGAEYEAGMADHVKHGRKPKTYRHNPSEAHRRVVEMMGRHDATDDEAMGLLHEYDVFKARTK